MRGASQGTVSAESNGGIMTCASRNNHDPLYNTLGVDLTDDTGHDKARLRLCVHMSQYEIALCGTTTRADGGAGYPRDLPPARGGPTLPEACMMTRGLHSTGADVIRAKMASREPRFDRLTTHTQCKRVVSCLTDVTRSDRCHMHERVTWITNNPPDALSRMHVTAVDAADP